jgi:hypothetical protein
MYRKIYSARQIIYVNLLNIKLIPYWHSVLSIPKILRCYFLYDRKLLSALGRFGWEELKLYFKKAVKGKNAFPAAAISIQNFGDFLGFNPQMHILISDGCFHENGTISISPDIDTAALEQIFRHMVFKDVFG